MSYEHFKNNWKETKLNIGWKSVCVKVCLENNWKNWNRNYNRENKNQYRWTNGRADIKYRIYFYFKSSHERKETNLFGTNTVSVSSYFALYALELCHSQFWILYTLFVVTNLIVMQKKKQERSQHKDYYMCI